jgi:hypothetical protein
MLLGMSDGRKVDFALILLVKDRNHVTTTGRYTKCRWIESISYECTKMGVYVVVSPLAHHQNVRKKMETNEITMENEVPTRK